MFQGRSLLKEIDFTQAELAYLIDFAIHLKALKNQHIPHQYLAGKNIALLFEKHQLEHVLLLLSQPMI
jgi:Ornithine carbamoyltransferase